MKYKHVVVFPQYATKLSFNDPEMHSLNEGDFKVVILPKAWNDPSGNLRKRALSIFLGALQANPGKIRASCVDGDWSWACVE